MEKKLKKIELFEFKEQNEKDVQKIFFWSLLQNDDNIEQDKMAYIYAILHEEHTTIDNYRNELLKVLLHLYKKENLLWSIWNENSSLKMHQKQTVIQLFKNNNILLSYFIELFFYNNLEKRTNMLSNINFILLQPVLTFSIVTELFNVLFNYILIVLNNKFKNKLEVEELRNILFIFNVRFKMDIKQLIMLEKTEKDNIFERINSLIESKIMFIMSYFNGDFLQNKINNMITHIRLLKKQTGNIPKIVSKLDSIQDVELENIANSIHAVSTFLSSHRDGDNGVFPLNRLDFIFTSILQTIYKKELTLTWEYSNNTYINPDLKFFASEWKFLKIFYILLENAKDADATKVKISVDIKFIMKMNSQFKKSLLFKIENDGNTMTNEELDNCLELWYSSKKNKYGVGLNIIQKELQYFNGSIKPINVYIQNCNNKDKYPMYRGCEFLIEIPLDYY